MKQIPLTQGKFAIVDDEDYEYLMQWKWCVVRHKKGRWYASTHINNKTIYMHRWLIQNKPGKFTDHRNGNGLDNRRVNLRSCSPSQNGHNSKCRAGGTSKFKGVSWDRRYSKWRASIGIKYKLYNLGRFVNEKDAAMAYNEKATKVFGEFAYLNIIEGTNDGN